MPARSPPHSRLWGPLGEGGALCNRRSTTVPVSESCRTSSTLQHHSPGGCTGDCDLQLHQAGKQMDSWLGQFGTRHDDDEAFRRGEHMGRVGFDARIFFPWDGRSPVSHPTCQVPFHPRRSGEYRKGLFPARPLYQGTRGSVWDPETSRERVGDWGGPETVWAVPSGGVTRRRVVFSDL